MVQVRIMHTDSARVAEVTAILFPLIASCPDLFMGDPAELGMRGGGSRIVVEVVPAAPRTPQQVRAERVDDQRPPAHRRAAVRRALPPGESR
ncbi:hypothetical protein AB0395_29715 [Streptosporangium sp. NPDC051023]|uniref:hypothetical protein n=1 Tax=Streptosporangium sp. NPDC051023 TaxID=3155410 RepID=UPI0034510DC7